MTDLDRSLAPAPSPARARALPWITVVLGSVLTALPPLVAAAPVMPPLGLLMLLTWRLLARYSLRPWAPAPLGLVDDLVSGQPLGSAVLLWTLASLLVELVEARVVVRAFWGDWLLAAGLTAAVLVAERLIASSLGATLLPGVAAQAAATALLFPAAARLVARIDRGRGQA